MTNVICFQKYKKEKEAHDLEELRELLWSVKLPWSAAERILKDLKDLENIDLEELILSEAELEDLERSVREAEQENEK